jgi:aspartate racemase
MHKVADRVASAVSVPFLHIIDATADAILGAGLKTVALLGTAYTMRDPFYHDHMATRGVTTIVPDEADAATVHRIIFEELARGVIRSESRETLQIIVRGLVDAGAQGVIAGCTEVPLLLRAQDLSVPYFDSLALHVDAALAFSVEYSPN